MKKLNTFLNGLVGGCIAILIVIFIVLLFPMQTISLIEQLNATMPQVGAESPESSIESEVENEKNEDEMDDISSKEFSNSDGSITATLKGKVLSMKFNSVSSLVYCNKTEPIFFSSTSEYEAKVKEASKTTPVDIVRSAWINAVPTVYFSETAPEIVSYKIVGKEMRVTFKEEPTENFTFMGREACWTQIDFEFANN